MNKPVPVSETKLASVYHVLAETRAENLWLANFTSANTKATYRRAVADFLRDMSIDSSDALYGVAHRIH